MKYVLFSLAALAAGQCALAQNLPARNYGGNCPYHTTSQQGSCVPNGNRQVYYNGDNRGGCPLGWVSDGDYCVK